MTYNIKTYRNKEYISPKLTIITMTTVQIGLEKNIGKPLKRIEDYKIVKGQMGYTDDITLPDQYYAAILHSPYAHALIKKVDVSKALQLPGVVIAISGSEVSKLTKPVTSRAAPKSPTSHFIIAADKVRYFGEPVAAVVAKDKYTAEDALSLIEVDYEPLKPIGSIEDALKDDAPLIYPELGTNVIVSDHFEYGNVKDAFDNAYKIVKRRFNAHRYLSGIPLETYVVNAYYNKAEDKLLIYANDQQPGRSIGSVSQTLGIPVSKIRLITPPAGGAFGYKLAIWQYEAIISLLSMLVGKPVKWVQSRTENLYGPHRPRGFMDAEIAFSKEGKILGMKLTDYEADGNWPYVAALYSLIKFGNMSGPYKIRNLSFTYFSVATNDPPVVQNSGVGKPFMNFVLERMMDIAAKELGLSKIEIRKVNLIQPNEMPYITPWGEIYESGNFPLTLETALPYYERMQREKQKLRNEGRYVGVGLSFGIEPGTSNLGYYFLSRPGVPPYDGAGCLAKVEIAPDGSIKVRMNAPEIGTGHITSLAQAVGDIFGVSAYEVNVEFSFDSEDGYLTYTGTYSNLFNDVCLGAVYVAANKLKDKVLSVASKLLKIDKTNLDVIGGYVVNKLEGKQLISIKEIANVLYSRLLDVPEGEEPGLIVTAGYRDPLAKPPNKANFNIQLTHANSIHLCLSEVNPDTWDVKILDYVVVHDAGKQLNPAIVESLAVGSTFAGIAGTLYEEFVFDEQENNLSLTFMDYLVPTAWESVDIKVHSIETPAPNTVFGTKAVGEGGTLTSPAAVVNSVVDALEPFGVELNDMSIKPEKLWKIVMNTDEYKRKFGSV
ncbi:MAG: xanthine dehydrogenase family protein molybdopterin-binding subunit [Nitrososphaeria archaeon]